MNVGYVEVYHINKQPTPSNPRKKFEGKENSPILKLFNNIHLDILCLEDILKFIKVCTLMGLLNFPAFITTRFRIGVIYSEYKDTLYKMGNVSLLI